MKKTFAIQVEYPDCDFVSSEEIIEVTQECIDQYLERHFGANIMDGDYDRIKVKEVTDELTLVKKMRETQKEWVSQPSFKWGDTDLFNTLRKLESEVDEYLKKMDI